VGNMLVSVFVLAFLLAIACAGIHRVVNSSRREQRRHPCRLTPRSRADRLRRPLNVNVDMAFFVNGDELVLPTVRGERVQCSNCPIGTRRRPS